jgi:ABC-type uncharacterized transport system ATPase component
MLLELSIRDLSHCFPQSCHADLPWQRVGTDLFMWKGANYYVLIVDIEMARLSNLTAAEVINHTKSILAHHGIPEVVISDNGSLAILVIGINF